MLFLYPRIHWRLFFKRALEPRGEIPRCLVMSIRDDFTPFKDRAFLLTLGLICAVMAAGGGLMKYLAG
jgi:hypothetical protein